MKKYTKVNKLKIFILIALLPILVFFANNHVSADPPSGLEIAMDVQEANTPALMEDPDVVGTAVGVDEIGRPVIQVFVVSAGVRGIPRNIEGFPVIVKVTGKIFALHHKPGHSGGPGGGGEDPSPTPTPQHQHQLQLQL